MRPVFLELRGKVSNKGIRVLRGQSGERQGRVTLDSGPVRPAHKASESLHLLSINWYYFFLWGCFLQAPWLRQDAAELFADHSLDRIAEVYI